MLYFENSEDDFHDVIRSDETTVQLEALLLQEENPETQV
jgi:hypothetical protein